MAATVDAAEFADWARPSLLAMTRLAGTVKSTLFDARSRLRALLGDTDD